jgi:DNA-directed RNA polymerase specialized sigma24 family protein
MAGAAPSSSFRISPVDQLGRRIDPAVLAVAEQILRRAVAPGLKLLGDPAMVANLLEEAAAIVSLRLQSQQIQNVPAYLLKCFLRKVNRLKSRQIVTVHLDEGQWEGIAWTDPSAQFDMKILCDEFLARCDCITQCMLRRRLQGYSWKEIGKLHGMSAHAAEERCSHVLQQVREKLKCGQDGHSDRSLHRIEEQQPDQCPNQHDERALSRKNS